MSRIFESGRLLLRQTHNKFPRFGQNSNFSGSDMKNLGKVRSFRALTLNNCKNQLPNLGEDLFFLEITPISG